MNSALDPCVAECVVVCALAAGLCEMSEILSLRVAPSAKLLLAVLGYVCTADRRVRVEWNGRRQDLCSVSSGRTERDGDRGSMCDCVCSAGGFEVGRWLSRGRV